MYTGFGTILSSGHPMGVLEWGSGNGKGDYCTLLHCNSILLVNDQGTEDISA